MKPEYTKLPDGTIEILLELPWSSVAATYEKIVTQLLQEIEVPGFRKGKAPRELAEKQISESRVYEETLKQIVPHSYAETVKTLNLVPIISPKVELVEATKGKNWKLKITTAEKPDITLNNYQNAVDEVKKAKQTQLWVPGKTEETQKNEPTVGELLNALYKEVKVTLPRILIEQETNRMLSQLFDELQKLGLTVEQYLQAQGKTSEGLRSEYEENARKNLTLEFALEEIADKEKVSVEPPEVDKLIAEAKTQVEKESLSKNRYYVSSLLRRQKTLTKLSTPSVIVANNSSISTQSKA